VSKWVTFLSPPWPYCPIDWNLLPADTSRLPNATLCKANNKGHNLQSRQQIASNASFDEWHHMDAVHAWFSAARQVGLHWWQLLGKVIWCWCISQLPCFCQVQEQITNLLATLSPSRNDYISIVSVVSGCTKTFSTSNSLSFLVPTSSRTGPLERSNAAPLSLKKRKQVVETVWASVLSTTRY